MGRLNKASLTRVHEERLREIWLRAGEDFEVAAPEIAKYIVDRIGKIIRKERTRNQREPQQRWAEGTDGKKGKAV